MSEDRDIEERQKGRGCAIAVLVLLPVLYVLSAGPAELIARQASPTVQTAMGVLYSPVAWIISLTYGTVVFDSLIVPYFEWWLSWSP